MLIKIAILLNILTVTFGFVGSASAGLVTNTFGWAATKLGIRPDSSGRSGNLMDGPTIGGLFAGLITGDRMSFTYSYESNAGSQWLGAGFLVLRIAHGKRGTS